MSGKSSDLSFDISFDDTVRCAGTLCFISGSLCQSSEVKFGFCNIKETKC